jgi:hypothetical protein
VGILTSQNPNAPEELEGRLFVKIHRIPAELLHSTELGLKKSVEPEWIPTDLPHSSYSEDS